MALTMKAEALELRGIENKVNTNTGNVYYVLYVEDDCGAPHQFYCGNVNALPTGLKKGDIIDILFEYKKYGKEVALKVLQVTPFITA